MEGPSSSELRSGRFITLLVLAAIAFAESASAQHSTQSLPPYVTAAWSDTGLFDAASPQERDALPAALFGAPSCVEACEAPMACCSEMRHTDVIRESLCGDVSSECWRPLTLDTFFSEGWREPWVGGPAGQSGLTPRHGWLGAFEGVFYRLWLVNGTYQNDLNKSFGGDGYGSNFTTFLPLNRRFELYFNAPFVAANGTDDPTSGYQTDFGDLQVAASFLLSETKACTQLFTLGATLPTGQPETGGGLTTVFPRYSFWINPAGAWVVRGGAGVNIPVNEPSVQTTFNGALAVGRYFRPHDVPLGDLVFYVNGNVVVPLENQGQTNVGVGPGVRFQITGDWYFLNYWELQVGHDEPFDYQVQAAIVKAW